MSGTANKKYLEFVVKSVKEEIVNGIAREYGISFDEAYDELIDEDAEYLYEYSGSGDRVKIFIALKILGL